MYVIYMLRICMYMICIFTFIHTYTEHNSIKYLCTFKISKFYKCQYEKLNFFLRFISFWFYGWNISHLNKIFRVWVSFKLDLDKIFRHIQSGLE